MEKKYTQIGNRDMTEITETSPLKPAPETSTSKIKEKKSTIKDLLDNVTVEPVMIVLIAAGIMSILATQNLALEKACYVNLNYTHEICRSLKNQTLQKQNVYERETQKLMAKAIAKKTIITAVVPSLWAILAGSFSDKTGYRKIFLIIPIAGQIVMCLNNIVNVFFFHELKLEVLVYTEAVIEGLSGALCVSLMTMYAFISAVTRDDNRTFRLGFLSLAFTVGLPIGQASSGFLLKSLNYYGVYGVSAGLQFINLLYTIFILKDPAKTIEQKKQHDNKGFGHLLKTFFDLQNIKETVRVVFKKGPNRRRLRMCILLSVVSILFGPMYGEMSILYISTRYRFNWDEVKFSVFQTYNFITHTIGTVFSIVVFSKYLKFHDSILGIISTLSKIVASFFYCFAPNETIFYLAPMVDILNGTSLLALRSIVSKLVAPDELGKVNSIFGLTENLMPLVYVSLYTTVYTATMETLPGAVFLMGASMTLPAVFVFIWLLCEHRMQTAKLRYADKNKPLGNGSDVELKAF